MEYQVPQFIEVEDKIFGPLSLKQFIYIAGGVGICVVALLYLPFILGLLIAVPVGAFTAALAFYKVNNKSFVEILEAALTYYTGGRLYLWKKQDATPAVGPAAPSEAPVAEVSPRGLTQSRLKDLAWSLDIQDSQQKQ